MSDASQHQAIRPSSLLHCVPSAMRLKSAGLPEQEPDMPLWLSDQAQDFLSKMLLRDPAKRSTAAQLLKHPWLKSLGFKPSPDQIPSSIEVVHPVLPPRPVVQPLPEPVVITEPTAAEEEAVEAVAVEVPEAPEEVAVTATGGHYLHYLLPSVPVDACSGSIACFNFDGLSAASHQIFADAKEPVSTCLCRFD